MRKISYYTRLSFSFPSPVYSNQSASVFLAKWRSSGVQKTLQHLLILSGVPSKEPLPFITHMIMNDYKSVLGSLKNI